MNRPKQLNCQNEPPYPMHETVIFSFRDPYWLIHNKRDDCKIECPHHISDCGIWKEDKK